MKVSKLFGFVLSIHVAAGGILVFAPGCRTTQPPTQIYQQDRTIQSVSTRVNGASSTDSDLLRATGVEDGSNLNAAFNAGFDGDDSSNDEFGEFDDIPAVDPIVSMGDQVEVAGSSFDAYTVLKGDSLWKISRKHTVSLNELYAANGLNKDSVLKIGQIIQIPTEGATATINTVAPDAYQPSSFNTGSDNYTVKPGDTLSKIATQYGTTVRAIKAANGKSSDMIRVGETLIIPVGGVTGGSPSTAIVVAAPTTSETSIVPVVIGNGSTHTVKAGEYPEKIAQMYGMTSSELLARNAITDPRTLQIGQVLNVSGASSAADGDAKTETVPPTTPTTTSIPASIETNARVTIEQADEIRVINTDPLVEEETDLIDIDSEFDNARQIPVIRLEE